MTVAERMERETLRETLIVLLEKKFSFALPEDLKKQMDTATKDQLIEIRDEIFEIEDLEDVRDILN